MRMRDGTMVEEERKELEKRGNLSLQSRDGMHERLR